MPALSWTWLFHPALLEPPFLAPLFGTRLGYPGKVAVERKLQRLGCRYSRWRYRDLDPAQLPWTWIERYQSLTPRLVEGRDWELVERRCYMELAVEVGESRCAEAAERNGVRQRVVGDILVVVAAAPGHRLPGDWAARSRREHHSCLPAAADVEEDIAIAVVPAIALACLAQVEDLSEKTWSALAGRPLLESTRPLSGPVREVEDRQRCC